MAYNPNDIGWNLRPSTVVKYGMDKIKRALKYSFQRVGPDILLEISRRIATSRNADDVPFEPYNRATIVQKTKRGHSLVVNLQDTSAMINSIIADYSEIDNFIIKIGVLGTDKNGIANGEKARKVQKHKNYTFLVWSDSYKKFVRDKITNRYFYSYLSRKNG